MSRKLLATVGVVWVILVAWVVIDCYRSPGYHWVVVDRPNVTMSTAEQFYEVHDAMMRVVGITAVALLVVCIILIGTRPRTDRIAPERPIP